MNFERAYSKIVASFATGVRGDISIADFQRLDGVSAHILLEYAPTMGRPKGDDIERYFAKTFEGKIEPIMASCSIKKNSVSIVAKLNLPVRPFEDSQDKGKMTPIIAGMMYLDNQLQDHWEVKEEGGKKLLAKTTKENIEQIIAARRNRMFVTRTPAVNLASLASVKELIKAGDTVKAYHKGQIVPLEISASVRGGFKGKLADGKEVVVAKEGVMDVMQQAADRAPEESAKLKKYYEEAYGDPKYAAELTKKK